VTFVGERVAAGVAEHVRVRLQLKAGACRSPLDQPTKASRRERRPAPLTDEDVRRRPLGFTLQPAKGAHLIALKGMCARGAILDAADVKVGAIEVHLIPTEVTQLRRPKAVPECHEDRGCVSMAVPSLLGGLDQGLDLLWSEVFAGVKLCVWTPSETNSQIN
jgi:hypothetical protein